MMEEPIEFKKATVQLKNLSRRIDIKPIMVFLLFLFLNAAKSAVFNLLIIETDMHMSHMLYKFFISLIITIFIFMLLLSFRNRFIIAAFFILQTLYIFANLSYYLYFHSYLHISQSTILFTEGLDAASHFAVPKNPKLLILLIDLPAFIYLLSTFRQADPLRRCTRALAAVCVSIFILTEGWNFIHKYSLINFSKDYSNNETLIVERYGTLANSIVDAWVNRNDQKLIEGFSYGKLVTANAASTNKSNFIILQVESMDSNIVKQQYRGKYIMPFLNSLSKNCIYYPYTLSYHKAGGTSDCEFSAIDSIEPLDNFPSMKINSYPFPNSFINLLSINSYHTAAFHGNIASYFSRASAYQKMGFREFYDMTDMGLKDIGWGAPDGDVFKYITKQLEKQNTPFLYYIITMTSHGPFTNARNYYNNSDYDDIRDTLVRDYFNSMSYVDHSIKYLIDYIRKNLKDTYVIIYGDHAPGINNNIFRQASFSLGNKYFEFVPAMIITPGRSVYREEKISASFLDIAPTVLYSSGISFRFNSDGVNLINNTGTGKIPYRGIDYDRSFIYDRILLQQ